MYTRVIKCNNQGFTCYSAFQKWRKKKVDITSMERSGWSSTRLPDYMLWNKKLYIHVL